MEPKDPTVEEKVPAVDDQVKDPGGVSSSKKEETLPTGSLPEVDTAQTATDEAEPLAKKGDGSELLERRVDDLPGLGQEQDKQLDPQAEARDVQGAEEMAPVSGEQTNEGPNEATLPTKGKPFYVEGDKIVGLIRCINAYGAYLEHGDLDVLIPDKGKDTPLFKVGDTVEAVVKKVEKDGTVILDTHLFLAEDQEDSSPTLRKWKDSGSGTWWQDSWYAGQWYQNFSDGQWDWKMEDWQCYEWSANQWISPEEWDEAVQKQLCGERIYKVLLENRKEEKEYVGKITGTLLDRRLDDVRELVADLALLENEARAAYNMLLNEGWTPSGEEVAGGEKMKFPRKQYHNALYDLARRRRAYSAAVIGEALEKMLNKGESELWSELWLDSRKILQELDGAVEAMRVQEQRPLAAYMDPEKYKKGHMTPKPVSKGYTKLCKFYNLGRCRNGSDCPFEHRRHGEGWPERGPAESETSHNTGDEDGDIGGPPTDEGAVDEVQQEREDSAFRAQYNYGKGASKGEPTLVEPKKQLCLYYGVNRDGCKYGAACRYIHDDKAVLEETWEHGKSWDNASRKAMRDEGFHNSCYDYYVKGKCRVRYGVCRFSHDELSDERLARLRYLVNVANQVKFQKERGLEIPDRNTFKPPTIGGAESSSSSAPPALQLTNVSKEGGVIGTLDEADDDVQKDSVAESTTVPLPDPGEPIEHWTARNQHLWVFTPHVSEVMITLGVTNVKELKEYIFVEDLVEKGINKVTACKILNLVGGVRYRPMSPDVAVSTNASVRVEHSSGSREAGRDAGRTISQVREAEGHGTKEMPRGSYKEILNRGRYREAWTLEQRSPLCVQKLQLVGMGMPPVNPPKKGLRTRSNPVKRGRPLLNRKQVQLVPRSYSNRRMRPAEVVEKPKPLQPPRGGLSFRFSRSWADLDDDDQDGALVSYAESSGESSAEEAIEARRLRQVLLEERDLKRATKGGNVPHQCSQGPNEGHKKSTLGEKRDKASRGETRQDFSVSTSSSQNVAVSSGTVDGSVDGGSLVVGSTDEALPGQGVAGQVNMSESVQVLPGQDVAGQETALGGAVQISGDETGQPEGEDGSNELHGDSTKKLAVLRNQEGVLTKALLTRVYWKVAEDRIPVEKKDCPKGSIKMDRNLVISTSTDGVSEQERTGE